MSDDSGGWRVPDPMRDEVLHAAEVEVGVTDVEGMPESERLELVRKLREDPRLASIPLAGRLAGRATPDRPAVPPWEYVEYAAATDGISLADLAGVRIPEIFFGGKDFGVFSIAEWTEPSPGRVNSSLSVEDVIALFVYLHASGVVGWDSEQRAITHLRPLQVYGRAIRNWYGEHRTS